MTFHVTLYLDRYEYSLIERVFKSVDEVRDLGVIATLSLSIEYSKAFFQEKWTENLEW